MRGIRRWAWVLLLVAVAQPGRSSAASEQPSQETTNAPAKAPAAAAPATTPPKEERPTPKPLPRDAQCGPLPAFSAVHFQPGEELEYDIDVLAANAARMEVVALPKDKNTLPIRVRIKTNTLFNKMRRVKAEAKSYLSAKTLHPNRYTEDAQEDDERHVSDVDFFPKGQMANTIAVKSATNPSGSNSYNTVYDHYAHDGLDVLGAIYYIRSMDLKPGMSICFDVFSMRTMWRVWGEVSGIEKVPSPMGEVEAFHITGTAARLDNHDFQRELHVWITTDDKRIPLGALGAIDLGPVRATLTHAGRVDDNKKKESRAEGAGLDW
jgi:hypothetical protein